VEVNGTIFIQIILFLSLVLWLSRFLFAPIMRLFDERERRIEGAKEEAARLSQQAEEKAQEFKRLYEEARSNARAFLSEQKRAADKEISELLDQTRTVLKERLKTAELEMHDEEIRERSRLMEKSDDLARDIMQALMMQRG
jgi:F-type H+-transporting ATPase subunit b